MALIDLSEVTTEVTRVLTFPLGDRGHNSGYSAANKCPLSSPTRGKSLHKREFLTTQLQSKMR
ncbi:hypothetical protein SK128_015779 [Halocaridina rubra]|uniref:Uncharacterized protein n=1 Tax=Halocaridina rubra TaxID=373956 RepID=A0AAN8WT91_HALRR